MLTTLLLSSLAAQGGTPVLLDQVTGFQSRQQLGQMVVDMGDLDGDGIADYAATSAGFEFQRAEWGLGRVEVLSGASGQLLFARDSRGDIDFTLGSMLLNMGDINGDGINDLFISASGPISAYIVSGLDGSIIYRMSNEGGFIFPTSIDGLEDINGDGVREMIMGYWSETYSDQPSGAFHFQAGAVRVFDGATGELLLYIHGNTEFQGLGLQVREIGDLDGDGRNDILTVDAGFGLHNFALRAHSSADGSEIFTRFDTRIDTLASINIDGLGDFNADGTPDILLSVQTRPNQLGHSAALTFILSGIDGSSLEVIRGRSYGFPGRLVRTIGDFDGDGKRDFALGEPLLVNGVDHYSVRVISGADASELAVIDTGVESYFGATFAPLSDQDGDGISDLMIGLPSSELLTSGEGFRFGEVQIYALH